MRGRDDDHSRATDHGSAPHIKIIALIILETRYRLLAEYEAQREAGLLLDFHLFPQGTLVNTKEGMAPALVPRRGGSIPLSTKETNVLTLDPRLKLMLDVGASLRLGQVARLTRVGVNLAEFRTVDPATGHCSVVGFADVKGRGKKESPGAALHSEQRASVQEALDGFLAPLEALYQAGVLVDYPMCPGGALKQGMVNPNNSATAKPVANGALLKWFKQLEHAAGVMTVPDRGWYGVRRAFTDGAPALSSNTMVLERVSGTSSKMLADTYRDAESDKVKLEASRVVGLLRGAGRSAGASTAPAPPVFALHPGLWRR